MRKKTKDWAKKHSKELKAAFIILEGFKKIEEDRPVKAGIISEKVGIL